jgi:hypothetical protein
LAWSRLIHLLITDSKTRTKRSWTRNDPQIHADEPSAARGRNQNTEPQIDTDEHGKKRTDAEEH